MDFWVFVAAAGAGCIAKRLQNASIDRCSTLKPSSAVSSSRVSGSYRTLGLARRKILDKDKSKEDVEEEEEEQNFIKSHEASTYDNSQSNVRNFEEEEGTVLLPHSNLLENSSKDEADAEIETGYDICNSLDVRYLNNRNSVRSRYLQGRYRKPLTSLESCLVAQLYDHQGFLASPPTLPPIRPLVVTDGSRIISHFEDANEERKLKKKVSAKKSKPVLGVPPLPNSIQIMGSSSKMPNGKKFHHHEGTLEGDSAKVLCLGIFLGIVVSSIASKKEVENLKGKLKQTDHLVQDLQEELEMRDSMTVKELASENYESQDTTLPEHCIDYLVKFDDKDPYTVDDERSPDSMTRIEAELEAELEMLGLNMKISNMGKRLSNVEIDPDFEVNFAQGELREDALDDQLMGENEANQDSGTISTTPSANYAVSPRQLSLRLHEVLQSRLEERIEELELALQHSQSKLQGRRDEQIVEPLVMNLSGEALNAYDEACEELMKFESEEDDSPLDLYENRESLEIRNPECDDYESSDGDEEKEKLLIQQIVERTKKGSPGLFNVLLSIDEDDD